MYPRTHRLTPSVVERIAALRTEHACSTIALEVGLNVDVVADVLVTLAVADGRALAAQWLRDRAQRMRENAMDEPDLAREAGVLEDAASSVERGAR
jgi:hypothetical protein